MNYKGYTSSKRKIIVNHKEVMIIIITKYNNVGKCKKKITKMR